MQNVSLPYAWKKDEWVPIFSCKYWDMSCSLCRPDGTSTCKVQTSNPWVYPRMSITLEPLLFFLKLGLFLDNLIKLLHNMSAEFNKNILSFLTELYLDIEYEISHLPCSSPVLPALRGPRPPLRRRPQPGHRPRGRRHTRQRWVQRERAHGGDWHAGILVTVTVPRLLSTDLSNKALHYGTVRCAAVGIV